MPYNIWFCIRLECDIVDTGHRLLATQANVENVKIFNSRGCKKHLTRNLVVLTKRNNKFDYY